MLRLILCALLLTGCATSTPISNDGRYLVECDGSGIPWSACFKKANALCANGYDVLSQNTAHGPYTGGAGGGFAGFGAMEHKNITVKCH